MGEGHLRRQNRMLQDWLEAKWDPQAHTSHTSSFFLHESHSNCSVVCVMSWVSCR